MKRAIQGAGEGRQGVDGRLGARPHVVTSNAAQGLTSKDQDRRVAKRFLKPCRSEGQRSRPGCVLTQTRIVRDIGFATHSEAAVGRGMVETRLQPVGSGPLLGRGCSWRPSFAQWVLDATLGLLLYCFVATYSSSSRS